MRKHLLFVSMCIACSAIVLTYSHMEAVENNQAKAIGSPSRASLRPINRRLNKIPSASDHPNSSMMAVSTAPTTFIGR